MRRLKALKNRGLRFPHGSYVNIKTFQDQDQHFTCNIKCFNVAIRITILILGILNVFFFKFAVAIPVYSQEVRIKSDRVTYIARRRFALCRMLYVHGCRNSGYTELDYCRVLLSSRRNVIMH